MSLSKTYNPQEIEDKWYQYWEENNLFNSEPDEREPYTIVIPPPNITGVLHMGHMLNNTIQDILTRRARLQGKNACWVPGTDHASIATEAKVVAMLKEKGIDKKTLTRDEFLKYAWEWKEKYGGIILQQLRKLGASCDWKRTAFTMDPEYYKAVINVFVDLHNKGLIYRGVRMVNWDPQAKTALSDEEVNHKEVQSKLYYIKYKIEGTADEWLTVATTRPETILGDTAICVNPEDERYAHLKGKRAIVPLIERSVPVIFDEYVDKDFGSGALKVTPAHDINDYNLGIKHNLEVIDVLNNDGTLSPAAQLYVGQDRFAVRKKIAEDLDAKGHIAKIEEIKNNVGVSERTNAVIEPKLSMQWFCKMPGLAKPALENVLNENIKFHPAKFVNTYRHWMENINDWCVSRQLWWGQRIPAYYLPNGQYIVAKDAETALTLAKEKTGNAQLTINDLRQDDDVLDTWFSSWLWPIAVFDTGVFEGKAPNKDLEYYYPTSTLVTAPEILFFWVARMAMAGYEYMDKKPFSDVYLTGIVRDPLGRKMSKSLGNSADPLDLIKQFGADGVRFGVLISSPAGNDLMFDEKLCEQGRNFCNKLWNALRLVKGWEITETANEENKVAIEWFENKLQNTLAEINRSFETYHLSEALKTLYNLIWDDFCSWYLEFIKPEFNTPIDRYTYDKTIVLFEQLMTILHPFMPFITEEIHQELATGKTASIMISKWPAATEINANIINGGEKTKQVVSAIRDVRNKNNIKQKEALKAFVLTENQDFYNQFSNLIKKGANLESLEFTASNKEDMLAFLVEKDKLFIAAEITADPVQEKERLTKELEHTKGFLKSIESKLSNERFVQNAPANVLEMERKKQADAETKIKLIQEALNKN